MPIRLPVRIRTSIGAAALLACGFGAAAAVLTVVNALFFRPLPYPNPDQLVAARMGGPSWSPAAFEAVQRETSVFTAWTGVQERSATLGGGRRPEQVRLESVSAAYFDLVGVRAVAGRVFAADEDRRGAAPSGTVTISEGLAGRRFGDANRAVGQALEIDGRRVTVIGVMPASFHGVIGRTDVWSPLAAARWLDGSDAEPERLSSRWFEVIGRVRPGLTLAEANAAFAVEARRGLDQIPGGQKAYGQPRMTLVPLAGARNLARLSSAALILLAGAALVVLMAAMSVAGLQIARSAARQREFAIRTALGATRASLVRMIATDAAWVVGAGLAGALVMRGGIVEGLIALRPEAAGFGLAIQNPFHPDALAPDWRVALALAGCAFVTWLAIVVRPAFGVSSVSLDETLRRAGQSAQRSRIGGAGAVVAAQVALATVLAVGASLLVRSALVLAAHDRGYRPDRVVSARIALPPKRYDAAATSQFYDALVSQVSAMPGIEAAGIANCAPGSGRCRRTNVLRVDGVELPPDARPTVGAHFMTPGVLTAIGAEVVAGRGFDARDTAGSAPVAVISEATARRLWPNQPAVGRRLSLYFANGQFTEDREVVGVVRSIEYDPIESNPPGDVYLPAAQAAWTGLIFVRANGPTRTMEDQIVQAVEAIDPSAMVFDVATMRERIGAGLAEERFATLTMGAFAVAALALAAFGVYALARMSVARRTREIAIRVAIGATRARIVRAIGLRVAMPAVVGIAGGLVGSYWLAKILSSLLHGVSPHDALAFAMAPCVLGVCVMLACAGPAIRASRTDPVTALKSE